MSANGSVLARAVSDAADCLVRADEPLASLQRDCGGEVPGPITIPELLEAVRKSRRYAIALTRRISAQDGEHAITAWIAVEPRGDGEDGCDISVRSWQTEPLMAQPRAADDERSRTIDRQLAELTAILDARQHVLAVSTEAADLAQLAEAMAEGSGRYWTEFVTVADSEHRQPLHWRLLDGARISVPGSLRAWRVSLVPVEAPGREPSGFELLLTSDEPLASHEARFAQDQGASRPHSRPGLVGRDIAPVLRQPVARIVANAETIRTRLAGPLADEYAAYAADIAAAGQHLLSLLDDLADLEVVEAEDFRVARDHVDLAEVARQAAGILGVRAGEKSIVLDAPKAGETLPAIAEFRRVLQILINLLGNAVRYSPSESQVWIRLEDGDGRARVIVADQGPGMSTEDQTRVFDKFERLGRSGDGGSGLGLYISRRLARAMDGDLVVESAPGQGARFILDLPADVGQELPENTEPDLGGIAHLPLRMPRIPAPRTPPDGRSAASDAEPDEQ